MGVIDPVSLMVGGAMVTAGRALLARNEQNSSDSERDGSGKIANGSAFDVDVTTGSDGINKSFTSTGGDLPSIQHTYSGVFDAAATGALSTIVADVMTGGWWDGSVNARDARPTLELQAMRADARAALVTSVRNTLRSAFKTYAPTLGNEAEAAQDLFAVVAERAAREWLGASESSGTTTTEIDQTMVQRAGDLASLLVNLNEADMPGSKSALYVNLLSHMASLAARDTSDDEANDTRNDDDAAMELTSAARRRGDDDENFSFSLAAVSVSVLEDATVRVAEAVASAYLSRVREGASTPTRTAVARKAAAASALATRTAVVAAVSASEVVRHALAMQVSISQSPHTASAIAHTRLTLSCSSLQPRLKSTRALEKFRNEVKLNGWMTTNYGDVVAMYEDWHSLMGVDSNGVVVSRKISVCRHSELAKVTGARQLMSMFLEFSDVVVPVARAALNNVKNFTSWLLVTLIGRSLGLVYRGIKESMNGSGNAQNGGGARFA